MNAVQNTYIDFPTDAFLDSDGFILELPKPGAIVKTPVHITVISSTMTPPPAGQPLTLNAIFTDVTGPPATGTVWFVGASHGRTICSAPVINGSASCTALAQTGPGPGGNTITAGYAGDAVYTLGGVTPLTFPAATTTAISISPDAPATGPVTVTATVSITQPGGVFGITDSVKFMENGGVICMLTPPQSTVCSGRCAAPVTQFSISCPTTLSFITLARNQQQAYFQVFYGGNTDTLPSSGTLTVFPQPNHPNGPVPPFEIHVNPAVATYGEAVTISATSVPVPGGPTPTGTVTFDGLGTVALSAGAASITVPSIGISALSAGAHTIAVTYNGDANYASGAAGTAATLVVLQAGTTTTLSAQGGTLTATVSAVSPGRGIPTGGVAFFNGSAQIGAAGLTPSGSQSVPIPNFGAIAGNITARYGGDNNFAASTSAVLSVTNVPPPNSVTLALTSVPSSARVGLPVTLTVSLKGGTAGGSPATGAIQIFDSDNLLGAAEVSGGQAAMAVTFQAAGTHSLVVRYNGDSVYPPAALAAGIYVLGDPASITLTSSSPNSKPGQPVTFLAQVSGAVAGTAPPSGTVQFLDGEIVIATGLLVHGTADVTVSSLAPGIHRITAFYGGAGAWGPVLSSPVSDAVAGDNFTFQRRPFRPRR